MFCAKNSGVLKKFDELLDLFVTGNIKNEWDLQKIDVTCLENIVWEDSYEIEKLNHKWGSKNVVGKSTKEKNSIDQNVDGIWITTQCVSWIRSSKDHKNVKDVEDEMEYLVGKIDEKEGEKIQIQNENDKKP